MQSLFGCSPLASPFVSYGVPGYFASTALALRIRSLPGMKSDGAPLGMTGIHWCSFLVV
ncbi:hypothetical protein Q4511_01035 [Paracoccus sp. 1_MG-2023]|uniref:hypothetical protein n=1 Tax=unclassified Paracoccus (in: a-proteobacteria) TaxID=2688777 RepID=UPI001C09414E|nr:MULTISPECIES: hypothetical protein [unclassified Paracoccus (in: a-proteobacteria)]MBU2957656.1 hypothetical protein [Paracoccus sp. C2R09]MDO6667496.1 hypothetical protein [Paracoccus sp. 1_MG-2023]